MVSMYHSMKKEGGQERMEGLVFLVIIGMVVRSLFRNSKEAQRKEAERRQARGEAPAPQQKPRAGFPGALSDWVAMLEGKTSMERETRSLSEGESQSIPQQRHEKPEGESSMERWWPDTPESAVVNVNSDMLRRSPRLQEEQATVERREPLDFLEGLPETVKGVVYAEILTRPQQRRRLRP